MKKFIFIALATLSLSAFAKDKVLLQCTTYGDALSEVQITADSKGDEFVKVIEMDMKAKKFMLTTKFEKSAVGDKTYLGAVYIDSASGGEVDQAVMFQFHANKTSATLAHRGSVFFLDCRN
jgi:hypothetical protein